MDGMKCILGSKPPGTSRNGGTRHMACSSRPAVQTSSFPVVRAWTSTDMPFSRSSAVYRVHRCESCRQCVARTESRGDPSDSVSGCVSKTQGGDEWPIPTLIRVTGLLKTLQAKLQS